MLCVHELLPQRTLVRNFSFIHGALHCHGARPLTVVQWTAQVDNITTCWGEFCAAVERLDDVFDIYMRQSGIVHMRSDEPEPDGSGGGD